MKAPPSGGKDDCWIWGGYKDKDGYGIVNFRRRLVKAHRISLSVATGVHFDSLGVVMHSCDNPSCVNPHHLRDGTHFENIHDMMDKGRSNFAGCSVMKGETHPKAKLTANEALEIFKSRGSSSIASLQSAYNVSRSCIIGIWYGFKWNSVTGMPIHPRKKSCHIKQSQISPQDDNQEG